MTVLHYNAAEAIIKERKKDLERFCSPFTPLMLFVYDNVDYAAIECLLKAGANPSYCFQEPHEITEIRLENLFYYEYICGQKPLHLAVRNGRVDLCHLLVSYGAEVDAMNEDNETPLVAAIKADNLDMVKYLLESGANPNCAQCLHYAAQEGRPDLCKLLISYGADLNTVNANNETPLVTAIKADKWDTVKYLIHQQIQLDVSVSCESLELLFSMANRHLDNRHFEQCKTLKDTCRQIIKQKTDLSTIYKRMKSCLEFYLIYEKQLEFLELNLSPKQFADMLEKSDNSNQENVPSSKRKRNAIDFESLLAKRRKH